MTKKKNKFNYKSFLTNAYSLMSFICFAEVVLTPLWRYNHDTLTASILVIIGWMAAIFSAKTGE